MIKNYITGIDKLELTCQSITTDNTHENDLTALYRSEAEARYDYPHFSLIRQPDRLGTAYKLHYSVFYKGTEFASIHTDYDYANSDLRILSLKINNAYLYNPYLLNTIDLFLTSFNLKVKHIAKIDIFLDSRQNIRSLFKKYFYNPALYHFSENVGKCKKVMSLCRDKTQEYKTASYYIGSDTKQICIYNKTAEIRTSNKEYITDYHNGNLSGSGEVYRFELRLTRKYLADYSQNLNLDWQLCLNADYLCTIVQNNIFTFKHADNARKTRCTPIDFFDFTHVLFHSQNWIRNKPNVITNSIPQKTSKEDEKWLSKKIDALFINKNQKEFERIKRISIDLDLYAFFAEATRNYKVDSKKMDSEIFNSLW